VMSRVEQARTRVRSRVAPGGGTSGTILDNVRAAIDTGGILAQFRKRVQARQPILGPPAPPAVFGSQAVSSLKEETTPQTGVTVKKIIV